MACDETVADQGRALSTPSTTPTDAAAHDVPGPVTGSPAEAGVPDAATDYEAMCRHYCETLKETVFFLCVASGEDATMCAETYAGHADRCFDLRCVPRLVDPSLCLRQCDSLAPHYESVCATADPADTSTLPLCPLSPAAHDAACRLGCAPAMPIP